jgi:hypothetical protein
VLADHQNPYYHQLDSIPTEYLVTQYYSYLEINLGGDSARLADHLPETSLTITVVDLEPNTLGTL